MNLLTDSGLASAGLHLRTVREFKGLSRKEAAERGNVSLSYLQKLETGKAGLPDPEKLKNYCKALGLEIDLQYDVAFNEKEAAPVPHFTRKEYVLITDKTDFTWEATAGCVRGFTADLGCPFHAVKTVAITDSDTGATSYSYDYTSYIKFKDKAALKAYLKSSSDPYILDIKL